MTQIANTNTPAISSQQQFDTKYRLWRSWWSLDPNEPNSIAKQLQALLLSDMEFRVISKARELGNQSLQNLLLRHSLETGYIAFQILGIRKLTDKNSTDPKKGVLSLKRLVDDVREHRHLFTRQNFVCRDGLAYDVALPPAPDFISGVEGFIVPDSSFDCWLKARHRHERFDKISGVCSHARSADDLIDEMLLNEVDLWLMDQRIDTLRKRANKFIAHSADPTSRNGLSEAKISHELVAEVHQLLVRAESVLVDMLLFPEVARDATLRMTSPSVVGELASDIPEGRVTLTRLWDELARERNGWRVRPENQVLDTF